MSRCIVLLTQHPSVVVLMILKLLVVLTTLCFSSPVGLLEHMVGLLEARLWETLQTLVTSTKTMLHLSLWMWKAQLIFSLPTYDQLLSILMMWQLLQL